MARRKRTRNAKPLRAVRGGSQSRKANGKTHSQLTLYKSPRDVMPAMWNTTLSYHVQNTVTNAGGTQASIRFRTEAYDVDPAIASTAMPGFAEFALFYARFRPVRMSYKFTVANQEAFPLTIIHGFSNSSIASGSVSITYAGNPLMQSEMIGPLTGMGTKKLRGSASITEIAGTDQAEYDDLYTGSTSSATLSTTGTKYCYCAIIAPAALGALGGLLVTVEVKINLTFFLPNWILS